MPSKQQSPWIAFVMKVKAQHQCSLKEAMKIASAQYRKQ